MRTQSTTWKDSQGVTHDLTMTKRLTFGEVALMMRRSVRTVKRLVATRQLRPVIRYNPRSIEIFECAVTDYLARKLSTSKAP